MIHKTQDPDPDLKSVEQEHAGKPSVGGILFVIEGDLNSVCKSRPLSDILSDQSAKDWEQCSRSLSSRLSERHEEVVALLQQVKDLKHELKLERQRSDLWEQRAKQAVWGTADE